MRCGCERAGAPGGEPAVHSPHLYLTVSQAVSWVALHHERHLRWLEGLWVVGLDSANVFTVLDQGKVSAFAGIAGLLPGTAHLHTPRRHRTQFPCSSSPHQIASLPRDCSLQSLLTAVFV